MSLQRTNRLQSKTRLIAVALTIILSTFNQGEVEAQPDGPDNLQLRAEQILSLMSPSERVGQLFLVTFYGTDISTSSDIALLVQEHHIGGVVLLSENDNFDDRVGLLAQVYELTTGLQRLEAAAAVAPGNPPSTPSSEETSGFFIPLFIGAEQEGSSYPHTPLLSGVTPVPSAMSLGATWTPSLAEQTGEIVGNEYALLGINMLLGPVADVVEEPQPESQGDQGVRVFGGDAFWVSEMTQAYVIGVHSGSNGKVMVVPRHFPGYGGADRPASLEIPRVRRTLDQLRQIDLQPFIRVTGDAPNQESRADALMTGHIRYIGFQGTNPRQETRPISLDAQSLEVLMQIPAFASWRADGGILMTDALGLRGVKRFYDPQTASFPNRRIAQEAFLAGNDLLYLGEFGTSPRVDQTAQIVDTLQFFVQQYQSDSAFRARVDESAVRIIRQKLEMYGEFELDRVLPREEDLSAFEAQPSFTATVAQSSLTLLSPNEVDLRAPESGDRIVIFTDTRLVRQCSICEQQSLVSVGSLQSALLRAYGPEGSGLIDLANIQSYSFEQLEDYLDRPPVEIEDTSEVEVTPPPDLVGIALSAADWVVLLPIDSNPEVPGASALKRFLSEVTFPSEVQIVVLSLGAPYYLDTTEVSKLSAYYSLYGYTEPYIDVAARAMFLQSAIAGAPPVSVPGIGYEILSATSPDPSQIISLTWEAIRSASDGTEVRIPQSPEYRREPGDILRVETQVILDQNGNPVPDGTPVEFIFTYLSEGSETVSAVTQSGKAQVVFVASRPGVLEMTVVASPAGGQTITFDEGVAVRTPIPEPTSAEPGVGGGTIEPTLSPTLEPTEPPPAPPPVGIADLLLALLSLSAFGTALFISQARARDLNQALLRSLSPFIGGLIGYNYIALMLPGSEWWRDEIGGSIAPLLLTWLGAGAGYGLLALALRLASFRASLLTRNR